MIHLRAAVLAATALMLAPTQTVAQETMEAGPFDPKAFQLMLNEKLGSKAEGVTVYKAAAFASVTSDVQKAVEAIGNTTDFIAASLCSKPSRPTKITLHLTAGFDLVFSGETGSEVEWDLEIVCPRMK
ncbi:hypothetical protein [Mesorhizobium sp. WSM1293]|uniref:hypothetical protein n=1 Tax=Mesorhizobium sp. WSM1293 TaxID=1040984 RepID=UPI0004801140|nr:hypothetical protein [Mesorhizobium sp. WSM1293]